MTNDERNPNSECRNPSSANRDGKTVKKVYDLEERAARFGESVIAFAKRLPQNPITVPLINQIIRSGASIGANYGEADNSVSKKEFPMHIGTCKKESRETMHWLRMIAAAVPDEKEPSRTLWREAKELHLIFSAIWRKQ
jgi:four helix bundle protein